MTSPTYTSRIRDLNDVLRVHGIGGRIFVTRGIHDLADDLRTRVIDQVRAFDAFTPENDPYGEHDFGSIEIDGTRVFFKVDYYDTTGKLHSSDPSDPTKTARVLTILLAEEY